MRIGFDAKKIVSNLTGIGNYSRGLVNILSAEGDDEYLLFAPDKGKAKCIDSLNINDKIHFVYSGFKSSIKKTYWRNFSMVDDIRKSEVELFHGLSNEIPFGIKKAGCPVVVTIHDLIFLRYPDTYDFLSRKILEIKTRYACKNADRIVAVSEQTKRDIIKFYDIPENKIDVLYQGCHAAFRRRVSNDKISEIKAYYGLPDKYMISVGTIEQRKNHITIIKALAKTKSHEPLIIVSKKTSLQSELEKWIADFGLGDRVKILNDVPFAHLPALYQGSMLAVYLSYFEGFGIPVLEGISSGVPVIAATGSCLEEAGGKGAIYCDPFDVYGVAEAMDRLLSSVDKRDALIAEGRAHVENFTDQVLGSKINEFYRRVLGK